VTCTGGRVCTKDGCVCPFKGDRVCGDTCVSIASDERNCGECGRQCGPDQTCAKGECVCPFKGLTICGGLCTHLPTDDTNCGDCGRVCGATQGCRQGKCVERPCAFWDVSGIWTATGGFTGLVSYNQTPETYHGCVADDIHCQLLRGYCDGELIGKVSVHGDEPETLVSWNYYDESGERYDFNGVVTGGGQVIVGSYGIAFSKGSRVTMVGQATCLVLGPV
jgi:hypothetical protein